MSTGTPPRDETVTEMADALPPGPDWRAHWPGRTLIDECPMPMALVEGETHILRHVNRAFCRFLGMTELALRGEPFRNVAPAGEECLALLDRVARTGLAESHTGRDDTASERLACSYSMWPVRAPGGSPQGILIQVTETASLRQQAIRMNQALMLGSVRQHEITEHAEALNVQLQAEIGQRRLAELQLNARQREIATSELLYRTLTESIPHIVWTATAEGTIEFANAKWSEYLGIDLTSFNREGWALLLHPDDRERSLHAWRNGLRSGVAFQMEHRLRNISGGAFRWYLSSATPLPNANRDLVKWFGTSTDIEDQKRTQQADFMKQKLESLGVLAGGIAHDFNNLLCSILGGATLAASDLPADHPLQATLANIVTASERAASLTRQMLAYAGKGRFLIEQIDVANLVNSACGQLSPSLPDNVRVIQENGVSLPLVDADESQMQQMVTNLLTNATESMDAVSGGSVLVRTSLRVLRSGAPEAGRLQTRNLKAGTYVVLEVRDNGCGMDEATLAKIFDPFFTTKFTGRGLGLAAIEGILRSQGGAIAVESTRGVGTKCQVYLPVSARGKRPPPTPSHSPHPNGASVVLVVDDDEMVRVITKLSLENGGYSVRLAEGGGEALRILLSQPDPPISLAIVDLSMPRMNGRQLVQQVRASGIRLPVVVSSGYEENEVFAEFAGLDIGGFIQKPFTPRQLVRLVTSVLNPAAAPDSTR